MNLLNKAPDLDVVSINRYFGWYSDTGRTDVIGLQIPTEVKSWYQSYKKPVLISEYGAGTVAGMHQVKICLIDLIEVPTQIFIIIIDCMKYYHTSYTT